jgi:rubredoxin
MRTRELKVIYHHCTSCEHSFKPSIGKNVSKITRWARCPICLECSYANNRKLSSIASLSRWTPHSKLMSHEAWIEEEAVRWAIAWGSEQ